MGYNIKDIWYCDMFGKPLFKTPTRFRKLHSINEHIAKESIWYIVRRVAVFGDKQIVNLEQFEQSLKD